MVACSFYRCRIGVRHEGYRVPRLWLNENRLAALWKPVIKLPPFGRAGVGRFSIENGELKMDNYDYF